MSLINQMLEDLEKRGEGNSRSLETPARYAQYGTRLPESKIHRSVWLALLCVALAFGTYYIFLGERVSTSSKPAENRGIEKISIGQNELPTPAVSKDTDVVPISSLPLLLKMSTDIQPIESPTLAEAPQEKKASSGFKDTVDERNLVPVIELKSTEPKLNFKENKGPVVAEVRRSDGSLVDLSAFSNSNVEPKSPPKDENKSSQKQETRAVSAAEKMQSAPVAIIKEVSPQQRAEGEFKQATIYQQQGRNSEAILALEKALRLDPSHAPARQLMISLFLEAKRYDEAIRELKQGLSVDVHQINFAMILARLLVERAKVTEAVDVLQRSVAYAQDRPDYLAFLAALLQKLSRHKEAVQYYRLALAKHAQNGVWWMGMGISLQADGANQEALEAYRQAKINPGLGADLLAFVDQKIAQIQK